MAVGEQDWQKWSPALVYFGEFCLCAQYEWVDNTKRRREAKTVGRELVGRKRCSKEWPITETGVIALLALRPTKTTPSLAMAIFLSRKRFTSRHIVITARIFYGVWSALVTSAKVSSFLHPDEAYYVHPSCPTVPPLMYSSAVAYQF